MQKLKKFLIFKFCLLSQLNHFTNSSTYNYIPMTVLSNYFASRTSIFYTHYRLLFLALAKLFSITAMDMLLKIIQQNCVYVCLTQLISSEMLERLFFFSQRFLLISIICILMLFACLPNLINEIFAKLCGLGVCIKSKKIIHKATKCKSYFDENHKILRSFHENTG